MTYELPQGGPARLDLLVVVDDTTAMAPYRERLATLPFAVQQNLARDLDLRIAVTTNDGHLRRAPSVTGPFITARTEFDLARITNFEGTLSDAVGAIATVGAVGDGPSQPLAGLRAALDGDPDAFLRDRTPLAILIVDATDDASPSPVGEYADWLRGLKGDGVFVSAITAQPSPRIDELVAAFPSRSLTTPIDAGDYGPAIAAFGIFRESILLGICLTVSGPPYDCTVSAEINRAERVLRPCDGSDDPLCWQLVPSRNQCDGSAVTDPLRPQIAAYRFFSFNPKIRLECVISD